MDYESTIAAGLPYFGDVIFADQGHHRFKHFRPLVGHLPKSPRILEIGSWAGQSIIAWDKASDSTASLVVVDTWAPYLPPDGSNGDIMSGAAKSGEIERLFRHNVRVSGIMPRLTIHKGCSSDILPTLERSSFDLIFIDGNHLYNYVLSDIQNAKELIKVGGIVCGDDLDKQLPDVVGDARHGNAVANDTQFLLALDGCGYHPGVTQAVFECFGKVSCFDGLWAMWKISHDGWERVVI